MTKKKVLKDARELFEKCLVFMVIISPFLMVWLIVLLLINIFGVR